MLVAPGAALAGSCLAPGAPVTGELAAGLAALAGRVEAVLADVTDTLTDSLLTVDAALAGLLVAAAAEAGTLDPGRLAGVATLAVCDECLTLVTAGAGVVLGEATPLTAVTLVLEPEPALLALAVTLDLFTSRTTLTI